MVQDIKGIKGTLKIKGVEETKEVKAKQQVTLPGYKIPDGFCAAISKIKSSDILTTISEINTPGKLAEVATKIQTFRANFLPQSTDMLLSREYGDLMRQYSTYSVGFLPLKNSLQPQNPLPGWKQRVAAYKLVLELEDYILSKIDVQFRFRFYDTFWGIVAPPLVGFACCAEADHDLRHSFVLATYAAKEILGIDSPFLHKKKTTA